MKMLIKKFIFYVRDRLPKKWVRWKYVFPSDDVLMKSLTSLLGNGLPNNDSINLLERKSPLRLGTFPKQVIICLHTQAKNRRFFCYRCSAPFIRGQMECVEACPSGNNKEIDF